MTNYLVEKISIQLSEGLLDREYYYNTTMEDVIEELKARYELVDGGIVEFPTGELMGTVTPFHFKTRYSYRITDINDNIAIY